MASAKEIQDRMRSIKDTLKITNAMYMISSSKLKKSKKMLADTEPYFYTLQSEMSRILRHLPDMNSIYFKTNAEIPERKRKAGYIVITADKGLAGSYNHNILKLAEEELEKVSSAQGAMQCEKIADCMVYDLYLRENLKSHPSFEYDQKPFEKKIWEYRRQEKISKTAHIEVFRDGRILLFDYENRDPLLHNAAVREIRI